MGLKCEFVKMSVSLELKSSSLLFLFHCSQKDLKKGERNFRQVFAQPSLTERVTKRFKPRILHCVTAMKTS